MLDLQRVHLSLTLLLRSALLYCSGASSKLFNQEFQMVKMKSSFRKFYGRHHDLVCRYGVAVSQIISDMLLTS